MIERNITYTPKGTQIEGKAGLKSTNRKMIEELFSSKELILRLFIRDFSVRFRQSILGFAWIIIMPLITVLMFVMMSYSGILNISDAGIPYPLYAITGLSIWNFFSGGVVTCSASLVGAGNMVAKINFPKISLIVAASGQHLLDVLIRFILIVLIALYYGIQPGFDWIIMSLLSIIPLYIFMLGIGFVMSLFTTIVRDVTSIMGLFFTGLMLMTPVVYPIKGDNMLAYINQLNPLNYLINVPRDLITKGTTDLLYGYMFTSLFSIAVCYAGWRLFHISQSKVVERI